MIVFYDCRIAYAIAFVLLSRHRPGIWNAAYMGLGKPLASPTSGADIMPHNVQGRFW